MISLYDKEITVNGVNYFLTFDPHADDIMLSDDEDGVITHVIPKGGDLLMDEMLERFGVESSEGCRDSFEKCREVEDVREAFNEMITEFVQGNWHKIVKL